MLVLRFHLHLCFSNSRILLSTSELSVCFSHLTHLNSPTIPLKVWKLIKQFPFSTKQQVCTWGTRIAQCVQWQDYGLDDRVSMFRFPAKSRNFCAVQKVKTGCGAHPTFYSKGNGLLRWGGGAKWPEREADHSPPSIAEVKNERSCTSIPTYNFMACKRTVTPH
jgi:hypothetical protein